MKNEVTLRSSESGFRARAVESGAARLSFTAVVSPAARVSARTFLPLKRSCTNDIGMRTCWSRKTVRRLMCDVAPVRLTAISRESTVVSLIQELSTMPPFSFLVTELEMNPAVAMYFLPR